MRHPTGGNPKLRGEFCLLSVGRPHDQTIERCECVEFNIHSSLYSASLSDVQNSLFSLVRGNCDSVGKFHPFLVMFIRLLPRL
jgi:hypothetical protein